MEHVFEGPYEMVPNFLKHVLTKFRIDVDRKHSDTVVVVCHPETYEEIKESELLHSNSRWVIKRLYRKAHDHVQCLQILGNNYHRQSEDWQFIQADLAQEHSSKLKS